MTLTIRKTSALYRFAYGRMPEEKRPTTVNLCDFVTEVGKLAIFFLFLAAFFLLLMGFVGFMLYELTAKIIADFNQDLIGNLEVCAGIIFFFALCFIASAIGNWAFDRRVVQKSSSLFVAYVRAKKEKFCPIVEVI